MKYFPTVCASFLRVGHYLEKLSWLLDSLNCSWLFWIYDDDTSASIYTRLVPWLNPNASVNRA